MALKESNKNRKKTVTKVEETKVVQNVQPSPIMADSTIWWALILGWLFIIAIV